jgi:hypothetical protein
VLRPRRSDLVAGTLALVALAFAPAARADQGAIRPGNGTGDTNHCHTGAPGQVKQDQPRQICLPPAPGSTLFGNVVVDGHRSGSFPGSPLHLDEEANEDETPRELPLGPQRGPLGPTVDATSVSGPPVQAPEGFGQAPTSPVAFFQNSSFQSSVLSFMRFGVSNGRFLLSPALDPSGANSGQTVFTTGNWYGAASTDGGNSFTAVDPTTIFPDTDSSGNTIDGGFCCDQVVRYVPKYDMFVWLMQFCASPRSTCTSGKNRIRVAVNTRADVAAGPAAWTSNPADAWTYWDVTSADLGLPKATCTGICRTRQLSNMDYPDLSVGDNDLYVSIDNVAVGLLVSRMPLSELAAGATCHCSSGAPALHVQYTNPLDSESAYASHLTQNVSDTIYWAGNDDNSTMRIFSARESDNFYSWRTVGINPWCNNRNFSSVAPNGANWLAGSAGFPLNQGAVLGSARRIDPEHLNTELWFAWTANNKLSNGSACGFAQPHIEIAVLDAADFHKIAQYQVWNPTLAFAYAALSSNSPDQDIGMSLLYGGGGSQANHAVGFWGDSVVYRTTNSTRSNTRNGDYVTIQPSAPNRNLFSAEGYGLDSNGWDPHFVVFGRPAP